MKEFSPGKCKPVKLWADIYDGMTHYLDEIVDDICANSLPTDEIRWEARPKELRWSWTNDRTKQVWHVKLSQLKKVFLDPSDPTTMIYNDFFLGIRTAFETKTQIEKLNKLKAFW